jgi:hypothetical protein
MLVVLAWSLGTVSYDMRVTFPFVEQGNVVLIQSKNMGTWLCLFDTDAKAANRAVHAVASLGVNTPDVVVMAGSPTDLPDQLDSLFGLLSPGRVYIPATAAQAPIAGLPQRFQSIVVAVRSNEAVSVSTQAGSMQATDAAASGPSFLIATSALAGKAAPGATLLTPSVIPNFAYDTSTDLVTIRANSLVSRFSLQQTGCISVFTRGSRCWVASDPRR